MSQLFSTQDPYGPRDDDSLLAALRVVVAWHRAGSATYARIVDEAPIATLDDVPFLHASLFKELDLRTEAPGLTHGRVLHSSATTGAAPSRVALDAESAARQAESVTAILRHYLGDESRPLVVLDDVRSLRRPAISARIAAAFALRGLATDVHFVLRDETREVDWAAVGALAETHGELLVYGASWLLYEAWTARAIPAATAELLSRTKVRFVHSGGWKRFERAAVSRDVMEARLLETAAAGSSVLDFYGLVEQTGVVYPLCAGGGRHVPRFAHVVVRDPVTLAPTQGEGLLQLVHPFARGAPYHSVLTEDRGRWLAGPCPCGLLAPRFQLLGRSARAAQRGCSDVDLGPEPRDDVASTLAAAADPAAAAPAVHGVSPTTRLVLAAPWTELEGDWRALQRAMARSVPPEFRRTEWAYLLAFVAPDAMAARLATTFPGSDGGPERIFAPRAPAAVWLPGAGAAMGPLVASLLALAGVPAELKVAARGPDLTTPFVALARRVLAGRPLGRAFVALAVHRVPRGHARSAEMARGARLRIAFGADDTVAAVAALPHPVDSRLLAFRTRVSAVWLSAAAARDASTVATLAAVFDAYGRDACTAPVTVTVIGGGPADAQALAAALAAVTTDHDEAAAVLLACSWVKGRGGVAYGGGRTTVVGATPRDEAPGRRWLRVLCAAADEALAALPAAVQTLGVADLAVDDALAAALALRGVARIVPLAKMHHFDGDWDGVELLRGLFDVCVVDR